MVNRNAFKPIPYMDFLKLIYLANILVAGFIGITSMFAPKLSAALVFSKCYPPTELIRLVGCLWVAIALLSLGGCWRPLTFSPLLLLQLIYKGAWLIVVALPAILKDQSYPREMAIFFLIWCVVLPFAIPWSRWCCSG
jgi:hypothetical protein